MKQRLEQGSISTFSDMVAAALRCEELKEISQLVDMCATFQASSADSEKKSGTFGPADAHKVKARGRLGHQP